MSGDNQAAASKMASDGLSYGRKAMTEHRPQDAELWEIMADVPLMTGVMPYIIFLLNVVLPGSGTMLAACVGYSHSWSKTQLFVGCLQMMTAIFIIGWLWSIWWGIKIIAKSR